MEIINGIAFELEPLMGSFTFCFHAQCPQAQDCLRYLTGQVTPRQPSVGNCVFPQSCGEDGHCPYFRSAQPVILAWGCKPLFYDVLARHEAKLRRRIFSYLGSKSTYYNYECGRYKLTPAQQQAILDIFEEFGYDSSKLSFANYEEGLDFSYL